MIGATSRLFSGKTLGYAARKTGFSRKGFRVYLLDGEEDQIGRLLAEDYELVRIVRQHPELNRSRVIRCEDYFGLVIFRVRSAP